MSILVSTNKLAEFITAKTPEHRQRIVRALKRRGKQGYGHYAAFRTPACDFLSGGASDNAILENAIAQMGSRNATERITADSQRTAVAFKKLMEMAPEISLLDVSFKRYSGGRKVRLHFGEVAIPAAPHLLVHGSRNDVPLVGGLHFYVAKGRNYELGANGAMLVAAMNYLWVIDTQGTQRTPSPECCMVIECFQQRITRGSSDIEGMRETLKKGCEDLARLWHLMDDKAA